MPALNTQIDGGESSDEFWQPAKPKVAQPAPQKVQSPAKKVEAVIEPKENQFALEPDQQIEADQLPNEESK